MCQKSRFTAEASARRLPPQAASLRAGVIVFNSDRSGNDEIYVTEADGSGARFLTNDGNVNGYPAWSKDGKFIYFHRAVYGESSNFGIYVIRPDGQGMRAILAGGEGNDEYPST